MTATETLRAAATRLRQFAADVKTASHTDWGDRPWHVEECGCEGHEDTPCIVAQGEFAHWTKPQSPAIQYVADGETSAHAAFIATMHPGVALALADWLDATAGEMTAVDGTEYEHAEYASWTAALALARLINPKETPDA